MLEIMEQEGIVDQANGSKPRNVLVSSIDDLNNEDD